MRDKIARLICHPRVDLRTQPARILYRKSRSLMNRRALLNRGLTAAAAFTLSPSGVFAQRTFPERPMRLVVPFPPGGPYDVIARMYARKIGDILGQPMVVENKAGGETSIGA